MRECNDIILWFGFGPTVERAKTLLAYYKGEISLDEIKSAGVRYQAELERQRQEEKMAAKQQEQLQPEEQPVEQTEPQKVQEPEDCLQETGAEEVTAEEVYAEEAAPTEEINEEDCV